MIEKEDKLSTHTFPFPYDYSGIDHSENEEEIKMNETIEQVEVLNEIKALENTNKWSKKQIEPHDCGWMYTTIDGNKHRIKFLKKLIKDKDNE